MWPRPSARWLARWPSRGILRESKHGHGHETHASLGWAVGKVERAIGVGKQASRGKLHRLRHCYVTRLAAAGVPARTIMELAGHTNLATTMHYMHAFGGAGSRAVAQLQAFDQGQHWANADPRETGSGS